MLSASDCDFAAQTWIGLAIKELKKELKSLKHEKKEGENNK